MSKPTSIEHVAREAGVSVTTASRVLNRSPHPVSQATTQRVLQAAQQLGYSPSALARALVTKRSGILGVLVGDNADPYFATIVHNIHAEAQQRGSLVIVCNTLRQAQTELDYVSLLNSYHADGILFVGGALIEADYASRLMAACDRYLQHGGRIVALSEHFLSVPRISIDNIKASQDMTTYLISLGHQQIGYVRGPRNLKTTSLRETGFIQALHAACVPRRDEYFVDSDFTFDGGVAALHRLMDLPAPPTAVFAANDVMAIGCLTAALQRGIRIPQELSIVGMDNIQPTQFVTPPLTTLDVPMAAMGQQATQLLFALIDNQPVPDVTVLPHALVIRGTAAPPAAL